MDAQNLLLYAIQFAVIVPAIVFHEVSHGYVAFLLGDTTAKDRGRLSLNPLKHIDPFGTILLPILMIATIGFGFGYAKPVPVNPRSFKDFRKGMFLTGIAGPTTNLILAFLGGVAVRGMGFLPAALLDGWLAYVWFAFYYFVVINLVLMFFNLIPLPPLDGSRVLPLFLSDQAMHTYAKVERYGFFILIALVFIGPRLFGFDPIDGYFSVTVDPLLRLLTGAG